MTLDLDKIFGSAKRVVEGRSNDTKPPLGTYAAEKYKRKWPMWWPDDTPVEAVDYVRVRRPKNLDEGSVFEVIVDFIYKRGLAPK